MKEFEWFEWFEWFGPSPIEPFNSGLEGALRRAWRAWLARPPSATHTGSTEAEDGEEEDDDPEEREFNKVLARVAEELGSTPGDYFLQEFSVVDIVFAPLLERVLASVYFYKGLDVKKEYSVIARWFTAMERRETYAGTQSDFMTHVHALPPLVGACVENRKDLQAISANRVRALRYRKLPESAVPEPSTSVAEAITRVVRHHESMILN